ncbi:MAG: DMT family transporter [Thermoleophilaceae bacterium]
MSTTASGGVRPRRGAGDLAAASPVTAAVLGALAIAFSAILVRLAATSPVTAAVFRCAYALPPLALLAVLETRRFGRRTRREHLLAFGAGAFFAVDLVSWHYSIEFVGAGLATVLANLQVVIVALVAWLMLGERPTPRVLVAVPVVLVGVVLISGVVGAGAYGENPGLGVLYASVTAVAYSGFILVLRQSSRDIGRPAGPLFDATLAATVVAVPAGLAIGDLDLLPGWPAQGWLVTLALTSQVLGWLLISTSLPRLPASLTGVLLTIQPVGSVILGVALLAEAPSAFQLAGVAVIVGGIALAASRRGERPAAPAGGPA